MKPIQVLTIAGHDPTGGAGLTADLRVFTAVGLKGLSVCTANTVQTENDFQSVNWVDEDVVLAQLSHLLSAYKPTVVKVGIIESERVLKGAVEIIRNQAPGAFIIWDPVIRSSTGFTLHQEPHKILEVVKMIDLVTPNANEAMALTGTKNVFEALDELSARSAVVIKSAEQKDAIISDLLRYQGKDHRIEVKSTGTDHHGTGCIYSATIAATKANGTGLPEACRIASQAVSRYRNENGAMLKLESFLKKLVCHAAA